MKRSALLKVTLRFRQIQSGKISFQRPSAQPRQFAFDRIAHLIIDALASRRCHFFFFLFRPPIERSRSTKLTRHDTIIIDGEARAICQAIYEHARREYHNETTGPFNWFNSGGPSWRGWKPSDRVKRHSSHEPRVPSNDRALIFVPRRIATHQPQFMPLHRRNISLSLSLSISRAFLFFQTFSPWFSSPAFFPEI